MIVNPFPKKALPVSSDSSGWFGWTAWVLSELIKKDLARVGAISISSDAAILFKVSSKKFESAPSRFKLLISSLLREQNTQMLFPFVSRILSREE